MGSKKEKDLFELFYRDRIKFTWKNLGEHALGMYETPLDALDILAKYSSLLRKAAPGTYALCDLIETERKKSGKKVNKIIDENLEKFCILLRVNYKNVAPSLSEMQKNPKLKTAAKGKLDRQLVINRIVERHRRLVKKRNRNLKIIRKKVKKLKHLINFY